MFVEQKESIMALSNAEEQLMHILWEQKQAFMKDLIEGYDEPRPASTTIATLLKRMQDKGFVDYSQEGRSRKYFPLIQRKDYFGKQVKGMIKNFFNNDAAQFASFFTQSTDLSKEELEKLRAMIDQQIEKK